VEETGNVSAGEIIVIFFLKTHLIRMSSSVQSRQKIFCRPAPVLMFAHRVNYPRYASTIYSRGDGATEDEIGLDTHKQRLLKERTNASSHLRERHGLYCTGTPSPAQP
jgi:hypothetical protein